MEKALLSTAYLPPIQYFTKLISYPQVLIEKHEHFLKQSFRNRCVIQGPNGIQSLFIPVIQGRSGHVPVTDIRIAYNEKWQKQHWRSLITAYNPSPFFEYYCDALEPFYTKKWTFLFDYNYELMTTVINEIGIIQKPDFTTEYQPSSAPDIMDFRNSIHPKTS
ncbi:MAG: WbqC family protein, partial [Bacteroidota bacterium]|nr:WbqC family protein [Bacteroidota bacterium]